MNVFCPVSHFLSGKFPLTFCKFKVKEKRDFKRLCFKFKEQLGVRFCSPAKRIKEHLEFYFTGIQGELKKKKIKNLNDFIKKENNDFFDGVDYSKKFNFKVYSKVLYLYLIYFSMYKEYGFTINYFGKITLQNFNKNYFKKNRYLKYEEEPFDQLKCDFIYFDTTGYKKINLENEEKNIVLLRELPFYIEDFFKKNEKEVSQEIIYMFSFLFLYHLVDYEFLLSMNKLNLKQEQFFIKQDFFNIYYCIFRYILDRNKKDYLKKYTVNETIMDLYKEDNINYDMYYIFKHFLDYKEIEELLKSNGIDNSFYDDLKKKYDIELFEEFYENYSYNIYISDIIEILNNKDKKIIPNLIDTIRSEKIIYLVNKKFLTYYGNFFNIINFSDLKDPEKKPISNAKKLKDLKYYTIFYEDEDEDEYPPLL